MYSRKSKQRLKEKLDYEFWLLEFISETQTICQGGIDISTIKLISGEDKTAACLNFEEHFGTSFGQRIFDVLAPMTFVASFKVLDMIYEWILEENKEANIINKVPLGYREKMQMFSSPSIKYPPLFIANPYLYEYSFQFYTSLLPYRNEIIHHHNVSVTGDTISITSSRAGTTLTLNGIQQTHLIKFVVSIAQCLTIQREYDSFLEILLRYHLDQLAFFHGLPVFNQELPLLISIELKVPEANGRFLVDLNFVINQVTKIYPRSTVVFSLKVIGIKNDNVLATWVFPVAKVPSSDTFVLDYESYPEYRF